MQRSYVCANVGNVHRYVDMYTSAYQRHIYSPTVGLHAEGLALQCLSLYIGRDEVINNFLF